MSPQHHRHTIRLQEYDYSQTGAYFITICTHNRECLFGTIADGEMRLNECGKIVRNSWVQTEKIRQNVLLDAFVVMPNHLHGIITINQNIRPYPEIVGAYCDTPLPSEQTKLRSPSQTIGAIVRGFKSNTTKRINQIRHTPGTPVWQRNYYERIIRNENELNQIREYITTNPLNWNTDENFIA